jgi:hypothetical protein
MSLYALQLLAIHNDFDSSAMSKRVRLLPPDPKPRFRWMIGIPIRMGQQVATIH